MTRIKEQQRDKARTDLAQANEALRLANAKAEHASRLLDYAIARIRRTGAFEATELEDEAAQARRAAEALAHARDLVSVAAREHERWRDHVVGAQRDFKIVDALRERMDAADREEERRHEQREADETASTWRSR